MSKTNADAIRAELKNTKSPAAVVARLKKKGIWVTPEDVWQIREDYQQLRRRRLEAVKYQTDLIRLAVDLVLAVGADEAQQLIKVATEIVEYIKAHRR